MSNWTTREELTHHVITLRGQGLSRRAVARKLGVSRNTVRHILAAHAKGQATAHTALPPKPVRVPRATKLDAHRLSVDKLLTEYPESTCQRVFEERNQCTDGALTARAPPR